MNETIMRVHVDFEKCVDKIREDIKKSSGKELGNRDISKIIAELIENKSINFSVKKLKKNQKPYVEFNVTNL